MVSSKIPKRCLVLCTLHRFVWALVRLRFWGTGTTVRLRFLGTGATDFLVLLRFLVLVLPKFWGTGATEVLLYCSIP